jgi:hypothetical protein
MIPWDCTRSAEDGTAKRKGCGLQKRLQLLNGCPALANCDVVVPVMVWKLAQRLGKTSSGEQRIQIELTQCQWKLSDVVKSLWSSLKYVECIVMSRDGCRELSTYTIRLSILSLAHLQRVLKSVDLYAEETDNSSEQRHAVLAISVVLHSKGVVTVDKDGKKQVERTVYECDIWHFFGESMSKGKKNDLILHNACL